MNVEMLVAKIEASGRSKSEIAEVLGITRQGLYNKLSGESEFKSSEIKVLSLLLSLTPEERDTIFFCRLCRQRCQHQQKGGMTYGKESNRQAHTVKNPVGGH